MLGARWRASQVAAARNLCGAGAAVVGGCVGVSESAGAPRAASIACGVVAVLALAAVLVLHLLERRATERETAAPEASRRLVPRSVPSGPMKFVNRVDELTRLTGLLERSRSADGPVVAVLSGLPGVGKSAVGKHWASEMRMQFEDGDLFADFSERRRGAGIDVSGVLGDFIRRLGPAELALPAQLHERVDLYKALSFGRRLLVVLDDVTEPAQVKQLRPAGGGSLVIATSYKQLEELHYEGAELVPVTLLTDDRARRLLAEMAGDQGWRFDDEPAAARRLVDLCGGLALPLCVCAARLLVNRGALTVAAIAADVADEKQRLERLSGKGEYAGAAVFGFAYADLDATVRLVYRRLGLHPGVDLDAHHAALLTALPTAEAKRHLETLADTHLLEPLPDGRYRFHNLVRLHARESAEREDAEPERDALQRRLVDWYYACIRQADRTIVPDRLRLAEDETIEVGHVPRFGSRQEAFAWLESERANLLAVLELAQRHEWDARVWQMAEGLWLFHHNRRHYADWIDTTTFGIESARRAGHREAEGRLRTQLSVAFVDLGDFDRAHEQLAAAERAVAGSANTRLRGSVREFNGVCLLNERRYPEALQVFREARAMFESIDGQRGVAIQDYFIGRVLMHMGEHGEALAALEASLATMRRIDDRLFIGRLLLRIGQTIRRDGRPREAKAILRDGIELLGSLGMRLEEAESYEELAAIADADSDAEAAAANRERARSIYRAIGHPKAGDLGAAVGSAPVLGAVE
jgi:tetratricopeptide (TPR) repeat protein